MVYVPVEGQHFAHHVLDRDEGVVGGAWTLQEGNETGIVEVRSILNQNE